MDLGMNDVGEKPANLIDIQGAWRRDGRAFDGGAWEEPSDVLWLQSGSHFCDVRTSLPRTASTNMLDLPQAFSGVVRVSHGAISFHHDLDSLARDPAHPDQGTVHRDRDAMYERGPGFEERWVVASLPGDESAVAEYRTVDDPGMTVSARIVRIGPLALAIWGGSRPGGAQFHRHHQWEAERAAPRGDDTMKIEEAVVALGLDDPLPPGWHIVDPEEV
jgi:hypothetical protein